MKQINCLVFALFYFFISAAALAQPPVNDECSGALLFTTVPFGSSCTELVSGTTAYATKSSPNPSCTGVENNDDVWYRFVAASQSIIIRFGTVTNLATMGSAIAGFALYAASCPTSTTTLVCNNLGSAGASYRIIDGLTVGATYYLRIWSTLTGTNSINFEFCVQDVPAAPANDDCANATPIATLPVGTVCQGGIAATTAGATPSLPTTSCGSGFTNDDIWYRFVATTNGVRLNFSEAKLETVPAANGFLGYALYHQTCPATTTGFSCNNNIGSESGSELIGGLVPGDTYYLRLFSYDVNNYIRFNFCLVDVVLPPNDLCTNAQPLMVTNGLCTSPLLSTLENATASPGFNPPACATLSGAEDIWYKVTIPTSGNLVIQSSAAVSNINNLIMEAYTGTCNALNLITCNDDGNPDIAPSADHPRISLTGRLPGEEIFIRILGKGTINFGPFSLCAFDSSIGVTISAGGNCTNANTVVIDEANGNRYQWVPILDSAGHLVAEVRSNGNSLGTATSQVYTNTTGSVRNISGKYYLDRNLSFASSAAGGASVRFYFLEAELAALKSVDPSIRSIADLTITKTENGCAPTFSGPGTDIIPDTFGTHRSDYFLQFTTTGFSSFYISRKTSVLPLKFISFVIAPQHSGLKFQWAVVKDKGIKAFEVQASSDGLIFHPVAFRHWLEHSEEKAGEWSYQYYHPATEKLFFRIKLIGATGNEIYSGIVKAGVPDTGRLYLYPNPVHDVLQLQWIQVSTNVQLIIFDANGRIVKCINGRVAQIDVSDLPGGVYLLQCANTGTTEKVHLRFSKIKNK